MAERQRIEVGETYGFIHVSGIADKPYKAYNCCCLKCNRNFIAQGAIVKKYAETGCSKCVREERNQQRNAQYINEVFGDLKVLEYVGSKEICKNGKLASYMKCQCMKCGNTVEIPLSRLLNGVTQCVSCAKKNLDIGHQIVKEAAHEGTSIITISGHRKTNKNNKTGNTGVSWIPSLNKYRAYIFFKRKQYHLGLYEDKEEAIKARKMAEEKIYDNFIEWYKVTYPEQWKSIYERENKNSTK